jgi:restriction system protein
MPQRSPIWLRLGARVTNWVRLLGIHSHEKRIHQARTVIKRIRGFQGDALSARAIGYLRTIDPFVFEEVVLSCLEEGGAAVLRNLRYTGDNGVDGHCHSPVASQFVPIQVKRWERHVCRADVLEFYEMLYRRGFKRGLFVHTGRTSTDLRGVLRDSRVILVSGEKLAQLVRNAVLPLD